MRLDAIDRSRWARATDLARRAGLDEKRNVWHNAMIGRDTGNPWRGVDYSLLRRAIRVDSSRSDLYALRDRIWHKFARAEWGIQ